PPAAGRGEHQGAVRRQHEAGQRRRAARSAGRRRRPHRRRQPRRHGPPEHHRQRQPSGRPGHPRGEHMTVTAPSKSHVDATLDAVRSALRQRGVDALLVTYPPNVRYLSGFSSPEDASVLVLREEAVMLTDGRYTAQAEDESLLPFEIVSNAADRVAELAKGLRLGVEAEHLTLKRHRELAEQLGADPQPLEEVVAELRLVKRPDEVELLREAARITDAAFAAVLEFIKPGVSEAEVALELERSMVLAGADRAAFDIIVASGIRGAMPHGTASQK